MVDTVNNASIKIFTSASLTTSPNVGSTTYSFADNDVNSFFHGTGDNQINQVWTDTRTLAASTSENLDLYGGLTSALNTTINFTKLKMVHIKANESNTNDVLIGGNSAGISDMFVLGGTAAIEDVQIVVPPGGFFVLTAPIDGFTVTNTTADMLKISNSAGGSSVEYTIKLYGVV